MKTLKYITVFLLMGFVLISCGKEAKKFKNELKNSTETIKNTAKVVKEGENLQETMLNLSSKTPLTKAQFESWLPQTLIELPLTSSTINMMPGMGSCTANYNVMNKRIAVMIIDGAGEKGAGVVGPYMMSSRMDYNEEDSWRTSKSKIINGIKVKETHFKSDGKYALSIFYNDRFAVDIKTAEVTQEELEQLLKELNLERLNDL